MLSASWAACTSFKEYLSVASILRGESVASCPALGECNVRPVVLELGGDTRCPELLAADARWKRVSRQADTVRIFEEQALWQPASATHPNTDQEQKKPESFAASYLSAHCGPWLICKSCKLLPKLRHLQNRQQRVTFRCRVRGAVWKSCISIICKTSVTI